MDKLTKEEVIHVSNLARIYVSDEELENYQVELKQLLDDVKKIKDVKGYDDEILISPVEHLLTTRDDIEKDTIEFNEIKKNIPNTFGNFVEVPVMINE